MSCKHKCETPPQFPDLPYNRPGLSTISYRIGTYPSMRAHILALIDADPSLAAWTHRQADEPGIALVESAAIVGDILTFYQQLYGNELFLNTAKWRESVADLVKLTGYRLAPGLGGLATFALLAKGDRPITVPKGFPIKTDIEGQDTPVIFETKAAATAYPRLSSTHFYVPRTRPAILNGTRRFELVVDLPPDMKLAKGDRLMIGVGREGNLAPSQLLYSQTVTVDQVWEAFGKRYIAIQGGVSSLNEIWFFANLGISQVLNTNVFDFASAKLSASASLSVKSPQKLQFSAVSKVASTALSATFIDAFPAFSYFPLANLAPTSVPEMVAYKLGASHKHFGHNAPAQDVTLTANGAPTFSSIPFIRGLRAGTGSPASPALGANEVPLDGPADKLASGATLLVEGRLSPRTDGGSARHAVLVRTVQRTEPRTAGWGKLTGASTFLTLDRNLSAMDGLIRLDYADVRSLSFHEVIGEPIRLTAEPHPVTAARGDTLEFFGTGDDVEALRGRRVALVKAGQADDFATVVDVGAASDPDVQRLRTVTLDRQVDYADYPHENPPVTVYGNLVDTSQGKSEDEAILGDGDGRAVFQTFPLPKSPLTYLLAPGETPPQHAELAIWVNGIAWLRVDSFFGAGPRDLVYLVREDDAGKSYVQFGDGKTGARLPTGRGNVVAKMRSGIGAIGPTKPDSTPKPNARLINLEKVVLPATVVGGAQPESEDTARIAAPLRMQSLGRLVAVSDYEAEALALPGVLKARATWEATGGYPRVRLTVLTDSGNAADARNVEDTLRAIDAREGPRRFPLEVIQAQRLHIRLSLRAAYDSRLREADVRRAVLEALGADGEEANGIDGSHGLFSLSNRQLGASAHGSQVLAAVQNLPGIAWVGFNISAPGAARLIAPGAGNFRRFLCPNDRILALAAADLDLHLVAVKGTAEISS